MLLKALKDIPTTVNAIPAGSLFHELDGERAEQWVKQGYAEIHTVPPGESLRSPVVDDLSWEGATAVIIASGESLTEEQCAKVQEWQSNPLRRVAAINTSFRRAPWADILYACDGTWWDAVDAKTGVTYFAEASQYFAPSEMWTQDKKAADKYNLRWVKSQNGEGVSKRRGVIHQGANSAFQVMNLLYLSGVRKFILLGVDCKGGHWHGKHPQSIDRGHPYGEWKKAFASMARDFNAEGVEVVNCSPGTALKAFPVGNLEEELAK